MSNQKIKYNLTQLLLKIYVYCVCMLIIKYKCVFVRVCVCAYNLFIKWVVSLLVYAGQSTVYAQIA